MTAYPEFRARDREGVAFVLVTLDHPSLATPIRISADPTEIINDHPRFYGTISRGVTFEYMPFTHVVEAGDPNAPPTASFRLPNVDFKILAALESMDLGDAPATFLIEGVYSDDVDVVRESYPNFVLTGWRHDETWIDVGIGFDARTRGRFPYDRFTRSNTPGLHRT